MDKHELLQELRHMVSSGQLSRDEVLSMLGTSREDAAEASRHMGISEIMYYIGGAIVILGVFVLCYQNWDSFNSPLRILVSFGSFVAAFVIAVLLSRYQDLKKVSQAFFLIAGVLAPLGVSILFKELGIDITTNGMETAIYVILTGAFMASFWYYEETILLFFSIMFATVLFHFIINLLAGNNFTNDNYSKIWEYQFLVDGLAYVLVGNYLSESRQKALTSVLYGFGSIAFLGSAMALGGWNPNHNIFWELIYPIVVFGVIFLSVYLKSKSFLTFGTIFLIIYILKLTAEYFTTGLGWPLALVLSGLLIMAVGYYAVRINKKYLTTVKLK